LGKETRMIPGTISNNSDDLCSCIRVKYLDLVTELDKLKIQVTLLETLRDFDRQRYYVSIGSSKTYNSKHLPQPPFGKSLAFDLAVTEYMTLKNWNPKGPLWEKIREVSRSLGLICNIPWDKPHHQLNECECK